MEIYESGPAYRGFLRSGAYPALSKRVMRGGGVVARGASWFALVAAASTAGYHVTQRLVAPPSVAAPAASEARPTLGGPAAPTFAAPMPSGPAEAVAAASHKPAQGGALSVTPHSAEAARPHAPRAQLAVRATKPRVPAAVVAEAAPAANAGEVEKDEGLAAQTALVGIDELLADGTQAGVIAPVAPVAPVASVAPSAQVAPVAQARQTLARTPSTALPTGTRPAATSVSSGAPTASSHPVSAAAKIAGLRVNGSLSASNVRRGLERIGPSLSACYTDAARRAGYVELSSVKVALTINEAGRVKSRPEVAGADLPGFGACLSSALSHVVCSAPDTGTATAAMTLRFDP